MKSYSVEYTEDFGETYNSVELKADSYTDAYIEVSCKLSRGGAITNIVEV